MGEAKKVDSEIYRIIKPGGFFICGDSLNNNPIYRINRYMENPETFGHHSGSSSDTIPEVLRTHKQSV